MHNLPPVDTLKPEIEFYSFGSKPLVELLGLRVSHQLKIPQQRDPFKQLRYIHSYLRHKEIGCKCVVVERRYIDRDHMEDHSVFYSRSLHPYNNWCDRLHFFNIPPKKVRSELKRIVELGRKTGRKDFETACAEFSDAHYRGFCVIKPLSGSPVGRTVLSTYAKDKPDGSRREFPSIRPYKCHLLGVELTVEGLGFQQQDLGVSACATTAIWSALQRMRAFEDLGSAMPAQITKLASEHGLPFGRAMPSEGLSIDQMCMALESLGLAPNLLRADSFEAARGFVYSATRSGLTPILVLQISTNPPQFHAVTVAGLNANVSRDKKSYIGSVRACVDDESAKLLQLYLHDDRNGPYLSARIKRDKDQLQLVIDVERTRKNVEEWELSHILIPSPPKIRLSFSALRNIALGLCTAVNALRLAKLKLKGAEESLVVAPKLTVTFDTWVERGFCYTEEVFLGPHRDDSEFATRVMDTFRLPRHVGVIRLSAEFFGTLDVLVDTTSTIGNLHFVGIVRRGPTQEHTEVVARHLSHTCRVPAVF